MMMQSKPARSSESRLLVGAWALGAFIYGWLGAGLVSQRDYPNLTLGSALGLWDVGFAVAGGVIAGAIAWFLRRKNTVNGGSNRLFRIVVAVLPALFVVSALATLVLTLSTYNGDWVDARQGLATAFAALIAAVGVVVSVAVSYQTGEENRLAQQENLKTQLESQQRNLETQLEHQRNLEDVKGTREQKKIDAELIKNLNERLHEIIPRRYGRAEEVSASYFQLAALYRDWQTLASTSDLVGFQNKSQQRNILKLLFGVYQGQTQTDDAEDKGKSAPREPARTSESGSENRLASRSQVDIRTLNSVIQDIFPDRQEKKIEPSNAQDLELKDKALGDIQYSYDLSYLDLRGLDLGQKNLRHVNLKGAHLQGANLEGVRLEGAYLEGAHLQGANLEGVRLEGAYLEGVRLESAYLEGVRLESAYLRGAHLESAYLRGAHLEGADLRGAHLEGADLRGAHLEGADLRGAHLQGADLWDVHLDSTDLRGAHLEGADLWDVYLEGADLRGAHLESVRLRGAGLEGADLLGARLERADLEGAHLNGARLRGARLKRANLMHARLERADLMQARLEGANLRGAYLQGANLWRARLEGANLRGAYLQGANLRGAYLQGANLGGAYLEGADLWGASLGGADLRVVYLETVSFFGPDDDIQDKKIREGITIQLKEVRYLPNRDELLKAKGFDRALVDAIIKAHEEHHKDDQQ